MTEQRLDPAVCAEALAEQTDKEIPREWTTDEMATFWHELANHVVLRLVRLKPEMVSRWPPED